VVIGGLWGMVWECEDCEEVVECILMEPEMGTMGW